MTLAQQTKLIRILGLLGSAHAGGRAAAGLLATRLLKSAGLTWSDVIAETPPLPRLAAPSSTPAMVARREAERLCEQHADVLTPWETAFLNSVSRKATLSIRRTHTLLNLAANLSSRKRAA